MGGEVGGGGGGGGGGVDPPDLRFHHHHPACSTRLGAGVIQKGQSTCCYVNLDVQYMVRTIYSIVYPYSW